MLRRALRRLSHLTPREQALADALWMTGLCAVLFASGVSLSESEQPLKVLASAIGLIVGLAILAGAANYNRQSARDLAALERESARREERRDVLAMLEVSKRRVLLNQDLTREQRIGAHAALTEAYEAIVAGEHQTRGKL